MGIYTESTEGQYPLSPRQSLLYDYLEKVVDIFGLFDKTSGNNGSHFVPVSPFASEGMQCSSCAFYVGPRACELVMGDIAPEAVCKFWIIPETLLSAPGQ